MDFMTIELSKGIMTRSRLRNIFKKNRIEVNRAIFTKQSNKYVSLLRKAKKKHYGKLDEEKL